MTLKMVGGLASNLWNFARAGQDKRTEILSQLQIQGLESQVLPTAHPVLTRAYYKIDWLVHTFSSGQYPNLPIRNEIATILEIYLSTAFPKIPIESDCKNEEERGKRIKLLEFQQNIPQLTATLKKETFPKDLEELANTLNLLNNKVFPIIQQEFRQQSGIVAQIAHVFFTFLKQNCGGSPIDHYELQTRATLLSHPALDRVHADIQKLKTAVNSSQPLVNRPQLVKQLRELQQLLPIARYSTIENLCRQLENADAPLSQELLGQAEEILNEAIQLPTTQKNLKETYDAIHKLREQSTQPLSKKKREKIAQHLEAFIRFNPKFTDQLNPFLQILKNKQSLHLPQNQELINQIYRLIQNEYNNGAGLIEKGVDLFVSKITRIVEDTIGSQWPQIEDNSSIECQRSLAESLQPTAPSQPKTEPIDVASATQQQITILKVNLAKLMTGEIISRLFLPAQDLKGDWLKAHIKKTSPYSHENGAERSLESELFERIDAADMYGLTKWAAKKMFTILEPKVYHYTIFYLTKLEKEIAIWIHLPSADQLKMLTEVVLDPLINYFATLTGTSNHLQQEKSQLHGSGFWSLFQSKLPAITEQISNSFKKRVSQLQKNSHTKFSAQTLSTKLVDLIFSEDPDAKWSKSAGFFSSLSLAFKWVELFQWKTLKFFAGFWIKRKMTTFLHSPGLGKSVVPMIHEILYDNLTKPDQKTPSSFSSTEEESLYNIPTEVEEKIFKLILHFKPLLQQLSTMDNVVKFMEGKHPEEGIQDKALPFAKPFILNQLFPLLQKITRKDVLRKNWLEVLTQLNSALLKPQQEASLNSPHTIERKMHTALNIFLPKKIDSILHELNEPHIAQNQMIENYVKNFGKHLSFLATTFQKSASTTQTIDNTWKDFNFWRAPGIDFITASLPTDDKKKIENIFTNCNQQLTEISLLIKKLNDLSKKQIELTQLNNKLQEILKTQGALTKAPWTHYYQWLKKENILDENILGGISLVQQSLNQPSQRQADVFNSLKEAINQYILGPLSNAKADTEFEVQTVRKNLSKKTSILNTWFSNQTFPVIEKQSTPTSFLISTLSKNPAVRKLLVLIAHSSSLGVLNFIKQPFNYPIVFQYMLQGLFELPPLSETEKQKALQAVDSST